MRKTILILCLMMVNVALYAQGITVRSFTLSPTDLEAKINPVLDANGTPAALIRISSNSRAVSFVGNFVSDPIFKDGEWMLYVPAGTQSLRITAEGAYSTNYVFPLAIQASCCYEMSIKVEDDSTSTLLMPTAGTGSYQTSYGLMTGALFRNYGIYLRARSDFNKEPSYSYTCDGNGVMDDGNMGWYSGESASSRLSLTAGALLKLSHQSILYAGAGYGHRTLVWETYDRQYAKVSTHSFRGIETEAGIILTLGPVAFSFGADLCGFRRCEGVIGIGLKF